MIVEFNGLPGAGKSTIANACLSGQVAGQRMQLVKGGRRSGSLERSAVCRIISTLVMSASPKHLSFTVSVLRLVGSTPRVTKARFLRIYSLLRIYLHYYDLAKHGGEIAAAVFDQGMLQGIVSLFHQDEITRTEESRRVLKSFVNKSEPVILINVKVDPAEVMRRLQKRTGGGARVENMDRVEAWKTLRMQSHNLEVLRRVARDLGVNCLEVDASRGIAENCEVIRKWIDRDLEK